MACMRVTGSADEIELLARSFRKNPVLRRRLDGMMTGYFEARAQKVVCLDLGTTGPNPVEDEIVAIAIVDWAGNAVHEGKYRPSRMELWRSASEVNGVAPDNQIDLPSFFDDQVKIREIIWGADEVIVYNAQLVMRSWNTTTLRPPQVPGSQIRCMNIVYGSGRRIVTTIAPHTLN